MDREKYVKVKGILVRRTHNAILVEFDIDGDEPDGDMHWIPVSLIHGGDERRLTNELSTEIVEFKLMRWKAIELGVD
jgi:hypothetical protein